MTRYRLLKKAYLVAVILALTITVFVVNRRFRLYDRLLFSLREWRHTHEWKDNSLWLPDYAVTVEGAPIEGVEDNLSGLTWNNETKTLIAVINRPPGVVELSTAGEVLRTIKLTGFDDPEAIEYIGDNRYIVADELRQRLVLIHIDETTTEIRMKGLQRLTLGTGIADTKGLEGLAWDFANQKLYAAKERNPIHIYEVTGFPQQPNTTMDVEVDGNRRRDDQLFIRDLSSLDFNAQYGHLLVLSDESKLIVEINKHGDPISSLSLVAGHGLTRPVPQAEGIAMDDMNNLYLVSEPNLFYVFSKKQ